MGNSKKNATIADFLVGKSDHTVALFYHFIEEYSKQGDITLHPAKTMIGIAKAGKRIAWITQFGKNFLHVVFPFKMPYHDNLCFQKIARVPGQEQFNHHFRMYYKEDVNDEIIELMKLSYTISDLV